MSWVSFLQDLSNLCLDGGNSDSAPFFIDVKEQLAATQVDVIRWQQASKDLAR